MSIYSKDELNFLLGIKNNKYDIFEKINEKMNEEVKWIFGTILGNLDYSPISTIILISSKGDIIFFNEVQKEIEYRFIPRSIYEEQMGQPQVSNSFADMFEKQDIFMTNPYTVHIEL